MSILCSQLLNLKEPVGALVKSYHVCCPIPIIHVFISYHPPPSPPQPPTLPLTFFLVYPFYILRVVSPIIFIRKYTHFSIISINV